MGRAGGGREAEQDRKADIAHRQPVDFHEDSKKARERTRMTRTGEFKRPDLDDIHRTTLPVKEEPVTK